jgi:hypothetical protein
MRAGSLRRMEGRVLPMWKHGTAPAAAGRDGLRDGRALVNKIDASGKHRRGSFIACNGRYRVIKVFYVRIDQSVRSWTHRIRVLTKGGGTESYLDKGDQVCWRRTRSPGLVYNSVADDLRCILRLIGSYSDGGGDQGDFIEESAHPKPSEELIILVNPTIVVMAKLDNGWALQRYRGKATDQEAAMVEGLLELDLDEEVAVENPKVSCPGSKKKQKTLVKECGKGALKLIMDKFELEVMMNIAGVVPLELQEEGRAFDANPTYVDPSHLTGTHDESRQEQ